MPTYLISDQEFMTELKQGIKEAKQGEIVTLEELKSDLSLD